MSILKQMAIDAIRNNNGEPLDEEACIILLEDCLDRVKNKILADSKINSYELNRIIESLTENTSIYIHKPSGVSLTNDQINNGWSIVERGGMWVKTVDLNRLSKKKS